MVVAELIQVLERELHDAEIIIEDDQGNFVVLSKEMIVATNDCELSILVGDRFE